MLLRLHGLGLLSLFDSFELGVCRLKLPLELPDRRGSVHFDLSTGFQVLF